MFSALKYRWRRFKDRAFVSLVQRPLTRLRPNYAGVFVFPPGHFHSPLLDLASLSAQQTAVPHDGPEYWTSSRLDADAMRRRMLDWLTRHPPLPFPRHAQPDWHYHSENIWFPWADAYTLSAVLRDLKPARVIEVGSGFSSAVMLDVLRGMQHACDLTFIEPNPQRLKRLMGSEPAHRYQLIERGVQEVPAAVFQSLEAGDVLFIDSSHVSKIGSDVTYLFLCILPLLKPGVWVHVHDIFYPESYPMDWVRRGWAWNESMILRAFLACNPHYEVTAFNSHARQVLAADLAPYCPDFVSSPGSSIWLRRVS